MASNIAISRVPSDSVQRYLLSNAKNDEETDIAEYHYKNVTVGHPKPILDVRNGS